MRIPRGRIPWSRWGDMLRLSDCLDHVKAAQQSSQISCAWHRLADALEDNGGNEAAQDDYYDDAMDSQLLNSSRGKEVCLAHSASLHHLAPSLPVAMHRMSQARLC